MGTYIFIQTPFGQNWIAKQVTKKLSRSLNTKVTVKHVDFSLLNKMHLEGLLIEDQKGDTILYAGDVKVRITDWFVFKKEAELKYIGLENAIIKFQRPDSVWRQQFLFDYFSSSPSDTTKKKGGIKFNLKQAELKNVTFIKKDAWLGDDMTIQLGSLNLDADKLSLSGNKYEINSLIIKNPVVAISNYASLKPRDSLTTNEVIEEVKKALQWNKGQTIVKVGNLKISNGTFKTDKQTDRPAFSYFDGKHILFSDINLDMTGAGFIGDTVFSQLKLTAKEKSGLEIKDLTADVKMTPQGMAFSNMNLQTNRSTLKNYFSMSYDDMGDMGNFIHKVKLAAVFDDSYVDSDDIAFFAPALQSWKKKISLKGKIRGQIDDLVGREMLIQAGNSTLLNGDITMTGLPNIHQTFIDFKANDFKTTYSDAVSIIPSLRKITNPDLRKIQYVNFKGNFTGFIRDFVTYGTIQTNLGTIRSDINMKLPVGQDPIYAGVIATDNFRLGEFLGDRKIGTLSLNATLKGKGFSEKSRSTLVDGTIGHVDYNGYSYENITIKGRLDKKLFEGIATLHDENADVELNGVLDFNNKDPRFNVRADIVQADLRKLGLTKDSIIFRGKTDFNFNGRNLDNFLGTAKISEAEILLNGKKLPFDSLTLSASYADGIKKLAVSSNEFTGEISGNFNIKELPNTFTYFLNKYYPAYIKAPAKTPTGQNFSFDITTYYVDEYLQLFSKKLAGFNNTHITGNLDLNTQQFSAEANNIPQFKFGQYNFDDVTIKINGTADSLHVTGETKNMRINDSLSIPLAQFRVDASNNVSKVSIQSGASQAVEKADINALVTTYSDGVDIAFEPSDFTINGKQWTIEKDGLLKFRRNSPADGQLVLSEGEQKIVFRTEKSGKGEWNDLKIELTKLNLGDIGLYILPKNRLEGLLTGDVLVENPTGGMKIKSENLLTQHLRLDNDSLGEVKASFDYDNSTKELVFKGNTTNQEHNLTFNGKLYFNDAEKAKNNNIALKAKRFEIKILERFLGNLFSDMQGFLTGDVDLNGAFNQLAVTGKGKLEDAGMKINFTQCFYKIKDTEIKLTPEEIDLDGIILTDTVTKNPIYIRGGIQHESFRNMFYALDVFTKKPGSRGAENNKPVLLLNTGYKDNKQFYGRVFGTGAFSLAGAQNDMYMNIEANASAEDSSYVTLPPSASRESGIADFLVEKKYGREMTEQDFKKNQTNITYDVSITANPAVTVKVQLDELTGDEIKGRGNGTLNIRSGTAEPLTIRGRFDIEEGDYLFTFQSFFKKPFKLSKGKENYIEWYGDPYNANVKFDAYYEAERVSFAPLSNLLQNTSGISNVRGSVFVGATLSGNLFKPDIKFSLDFPSNSVAVTDPELALIIQQMQKSANEINRQVTYLIVFNSFAPSELAGDVTDAGLGIDINTISGMLLNVVSDQLNKKLNNLLKSEKYNISLNASLYNRNVIDQNTSLSSLGSNLNFSIGRSFFNNRFIISTGLGLDDPFGQLSYQQGLQFLPDVTMEWLINPSGSIRVSFFYRENTDYLNGGNGKSAKRYGGNISYRKDFNKLSDLFKRKNKGNKQPETTPVPPEAKKEEEINKTN